MEPIITKKRNLGISNISLSPIGLGTWQFSGSKGWMSKFWSSVPYDTAKEIVQKSLEGGINWFDTAEAYGKGESEKNLTKILRELNIKDDDVFIATKWWPLFRLAKNITHTIHERLDALNKYPIGLYQVHNSLSFSTIESQMDNMAQLAEKGIIKYVGVSNFSASQMEKAWKELDKRGMKLVSNQMKFNLLDRKIERNGVMDLARELGISIIAYSPLAQGLLTGKFHDDPEKLNSISTMRRTSNQMTRKKLDETKELIAELKKLAKKYEASPAEIAINWVIHSHGETVFTIPGASKPYQAETNTRAMSFQLTNAEIEMLSMI